MSNDNKVMQQLMTRVVFTLNNYTDEEVIQLREIDLTKVKYIVFEKEIGEKCQTPHVQGYMEVYKQTRGSAIKKLLPLRTSIGKARGNAAQNFDYCSKEGKYEEYGEVETIHKKIKNQKKGNQGKRTDITKVKELARTGGMRAVVEECDNYQNIKIAEKYLQYKEEPRDWETEVIWLYGAPGIGKSRKAREILQEKGYDKSQIYTKNTGTKWFGRYDAHEAVILDDFRPGWWELTFMLGLLDRYEFVVEAKGSERQFKPKVIIVTSVKDPVTMYNRLQEKCGDEPIEQLTRRIHRLEEVFAKERYVTESPLLPSTSKNNTNIKSEGTVALEVGENYVLNMEMENNSSEEDQKVIQADNHYKRRFKKTLYKSWQDVIKKMPNNKVKDQRSMYKVLKDIPVSKWPRVEEVEKALEDYKDYKDQNIVWMYPNEGQEDLTVYYKGLNYNSLTKEQAIDYIRLHKDS